MDYSTLVQQYPGYAGWGETEALGDYNATGGAGKGGSTTSTGGPDISGVPSVTGYAETLNASEDVALGDLITTMQGQTSPLDLYAQFEEEAGLPTLKNTAKTLTGEISNVEDILEGIPGQIAANTRESLVTEGRRGLMEQAQQEPWYDKLTKLTKGLGKISDLISISNQGVLTKTQLAIQAQEMQLQPLQLKYSALVDRNSRLLSAFTEDRQTQLDQIYKTWERNNQLSDMEWQLAAELSRDESKYIKELKSTAASVGADANSDDPDTLLMNIAKMVNEETAWNRANKNKASSSDVAKASLKSQMETDIQNGMSGTDLINMYADDLGLSAVVAAYNQGPLGAMYGNLSSDEITNYAQYGVANYKPKEVSKTVISTVNNKDGTRNVYYSDGTYELNVK